MRIFNVLYKYNGNQKVMQYYCKDMEELLKEVKRDKKVVANNNKCVAEIYSIKKNYLGEL